jgi:hypothetical protein
MLASAAALAEIKARACGSKSLAAGVNAASFPGVSA